MPSRTLIRASHNETLRRAVTGFRPLRALAGRFVAGTTMDDVVAVARTLAGSGLLVTLDLLGEDVHDPGQAATTAQAYLALLERIEAEGLSPVAEVSVKLSALGQGLAAGGVGGAGGAAIAAEFAARICAAAERAGTTLTLDMEDHRTVDATLATLADLRIDYPWVGAVLQSALLRTPADCRALATQGSRVRLVKGAYAEPATVAHPQKADVDQAYRQCLDILMNGPGYPMIATHDLQMIEAAKSAAAAAGRSPDSFEFQMLLGIRAAEQVRLAEAGYRVRVYVPYGRDCYPYFMRRLAERPANVAFLLRSLVTR